MMNSIQTYDIEYEIPPLRAIYHCECDAYSEDEARKIFKDSMTNPPARIRKVTLSKDAKP